jgi:(2Fe-2S) ferredoxin
MEKTSIEKIKEILFSSNEKVEEVVVEDFAEAKTVDGIILNISSIEKDGIVEIVSEDGKELASAGEYVMEDGSTIVVSEEGVIMEVKPADKEEIVEEMSEEVVEEEVVVEEEANPLEARLEALESLVESKFSDLGENFAKIIVEKNEEIKSLEEKFEAFAKAPAKEEIKVSKKDVKNSRALALGNIRRKK